MMRTPSSVASRRAKAPDDLYKRYFDTRALSEALASPLSAEDQCVQSMPDASPAKWHLAHTTWFFERMILAGRDYRLFDPRYDEIFNSYYLGLGAPFPRAERGLLTRPSLDEVRAYRRHVDDAMCSAFGDARVTPLIELGIHHEQQHQELLLSDIKHAFSRNPLRPAYRSPGPQAGRAAPPLDWSRYTGSLTSPMVK